MPRFHNARKATVGRKNKKIKSDYLKTWLFRKDGVVRFWEDLLIFKLNPVLGHLNPQKKFAPRDLVAYTHGLAGRATRSQLRPTRSNTANFAVSLSELCRSCRSERAFEPLYKCRSEHFLRLAYKCAEVNTSPNHSSYLPPVVIFNKDEREAELLCTLTTGGVRSVRRGPIPHPPARR